MTKEMLINTVEGQECRIAILEDGRLEELYVERVSSASRVGNIYKGRIVNVEPAIQAAFVDFGAVKNGFLHISDVHPQHFPKGAKGPEPVGRKRSHHERPPIQECLRRGQEVVVQMTKEGIGTKGPSMTTYISIPGRLLVMMPGMSRLGVSRKIEDEESRQKLK
jgi:ribonuclease E